jgi:PAS domain S-box-containing protein
MAAASAALSALRAERNRFVAFTFATSDLVVETDLSGRMCFAAGTAEAFFGCPVSELEGRGLYQLIAAGDDVALRSAAERLAPGRRLAQSFVRVLGVDGMQTEVQVSGYRLPDRPDRMFFSLSQVLPRLFAPDDLVTRDLESGLLDRGSFGREVSARAGHAGAEQMTLINIVDLAGVCSGMDEDANAALLESISTLLRSHALDGRLAGRLDEEKFGIVPAVPVAPDVLSSELKKIVDELNPSGGKVMVGVHSVVLDGPCSDSYAERLLRPGRGHISVSDAFGWLQGHACRDPRLDDPHQADDPR